MTLVQVRFKQSTVANEANPQTANFRKVTKVTGHETPGTGTITITQEDGKVHSIDGSTVLRVTVQDVNPTTTAAIWNAKDLGQKLSMITNATAYGDNKAAVKAAVEKQFNLTYEALDPVIGAAVESSLQEAVDANFAEQVRQALGGAS